MENYKGYTCDWIDTDLLNYVLTRGTLDTALRPVDQNFSLYCCRCLAGAVIPAREWSYGNDSTGGARGLAQRLGVPLGLHPCSPDTRMAPQTEGKLSEEMQGVETAGGRSQHRTHCFLPDA